MKEDKVIKVTIAGKERFQRLLAGVPQTEGMKAGAVVLQPGESVGEHTTEAREEAILILKGTADVFIEGVKDFSAGEAELIYIRPQTKHDIRNNSKNPLQYIYIVK